MGRKQHTVSRFYLSGFVTSAHGRIRVFSKSGRAPYWSTPKNCGFESHFYSLPKDDGGWDTAIDDQLTEIENKAAPAVKRLIAETPISGDDRVVISNFIAIQMKRTTTIRGMADLERQRIQETENALRWIDGHRHQLEERFPREEIEAHCEKLIESGTGIELPEKYYLSHIFTGLQRLTSSIHSMRWRVEKAPIGLHFVTSDNPAFPRRREWIESPGVVGIEKDHLNVELGVPLSASAFLVCDWDGRRPPLEYCSATKSRLQHLNYRTVLSAWDCVFCPTDSEEIGNLVESNASFRVKLPPLPLGFTQRNRG